MPTTVRAVASSIAPRSASPVGGLRSSVSTSIKSPSVRMISIGPEGGRARVDTSFGNPFARMRPASPSLNPGGKIFGENGPARSSGIERTLVPSIGSINFKRPTPRVGFTPESAAKADIGATFAKARARNQAEVAERKANDSRTAEALIASALPNLKTSNPNRSIDFRGFQTLPQAKEPAQESPAKKGFNPAEFKTVTPPVETPKITAQELTKKITRPQVRLNIQELAASVARLKTARNKQVEISTQVNAALEANRQRVFRTTRLVDVLRAKATIPAELASRARIIRLMQSPGLKGSEVQTMESDKKTVQPSLAERPQSLPQLTIEKVRSFSALQPLVDKGVISEEQAMQRAGVISQPHVDIPKPAIEPKPAVRPRVEGVSAKQADILATMAPIIREGSSEAKAQVYQATGINSDLAQRFIQELGTTTKAVPQVEIPPPTPEQAAVQQALQVVRLPELGVLTGVETETEIKNRALALIGVIRQTQQLSALGNTEADNAQLIERQLAELVPQKLRAQVSSFLVKMIRQTAVEKLAEDPSKKGLHQVDLETQNKRVKVVTKGIDTAPQNDKGEIDRDYVIDMVKTDKESKLSRLARQLKQNFDGSRDYLLIAIQNAQKWVSPQELARVADNAMYERPAVESAEKQSTREVGRKEVGTVMDPMWAEMVRSLIRTLIITPQLTPVRA